MTQIARIGTREPVQPLRVSCPIPLEPIDAYAEFFGVEPAVGPEISVTFNRADAHRRFLTASESLWASFEPELQRRTNQLEAELSMTAQTQSVLLECLPSQESSTRLVARRLGVSSRTLQRRLAAEDVTFSDLVRSTRERLAMHYLTNTSRPHREIAFLLGFNEPSSFFRAFRDWTGHTPQTVRAAKSLDDS